MKDKKGFSLLEILIALAVMLVGIVGIAALFPVGLRSAKVTSNFTRAAILAEKRVEDLKRAGFPGVTSSVWTQFTATDDADFWWKEDITDPVPAISNLRKVEVKIGWNDRGDSYSTNYLSFITYVADNN